MTSEPMASLASATSALLKRFRHCFEREKTFQHWLAYLPGLMTDVPRKSVEPIALAAGVALVAGHDSRM